MSESAAFPPPPPPSSPATTPGGGRAARAITAIAILGVVSALVFGVLWLGARGGRNDAARERDIALTERDAANENSIRLSNELQTTRDELAAADGSTPASDDVAPLEAEIETLTAEVERLDAENEALQSDLDAALAASETTVVPETTTPPDTTTPETTTPDSTAPATTAAPASGGTVPTSVTDLGRRLSSIYRSGVLGEGQQECLGRTVLDDLGADELTAILESDDPGSSEALADSLRAAASSCGIDQSAIFG